MNQADPHSANGAEPPSSSGEALAELYETLRAIAQKQMASERANHTLQATAVVHEAYLRIADVDESIWRDRNHFLSVASSTIRRVLVDHARGRGRDKRGGGGERVQLHSGIYEDVPAGVDPTVDVLALHEALNALAQKDESLARIVELRFFGGLSIDDAADVMDIGRNTAVRRWRAARAWLKRELGPADQESRELEDEAPDDGA